MRPRPPPGITSTYWRTQRGAELDLLLIKGGKRVGFEFKCTDAPSMTRSVHVALADLALDALYLVYPGARSYRLHEKVQAMPLGEVFTFDSFWKLRM
jgi:predicted AAA+ superfamily ATPase